MKNRTGLLLVAFLLAGCEEPVRKSRPPEKPVRASEQRRAHAVTTPGLVGRAGDASFYVELQSERKESEAKRVVLVEEDAKRREVGFAFLGAPVRKGFVDLDIVVVATKDTVVCYDVARHEKRWATSFAEDDKEVDDFVRRGDKLDVSLEGGTSLTLDLETGRRSVP